MLKRNKRFTSMVFGVFLAVALTTICSSSASAASNRLWGQDRYETSAAISKSGWTTSDYVIIASGEGYADALCAAPLAKKYNAPILLTESKALNSTTKEEIKRLNAKHVFIIGKYASVSQEGEDELKALTGDVKRLGGNDRYETSVIVAKELGNIEELVITSGYGFADALSIAPIASQKNMPILLTEKDALPEIVKSYINENKSNIKNSYVLGGQGVISDAEVAEVPTTTVRLSGKDRFETNLNVMNYFKSSLSFDNLYVVQADGPTGNEFADALSGSVLAAKTSSPIVLTYKTLSSDVQSFIKSNSVSKTSVTALGGTAAVPEDLVDTLQNAISVAVLTTPTTSNTQNNGTSSSSGSSSSSSTNSSTNTTSEQQLSSTATKLKAIIPTLNTQKEKDVATKIADTINKVQANPSYDYKNDMTDAKKIYSSLSAEEKQDLKSKIFKTMNLTELLQLKSAFGL